MKPTGQKFSQVYLDRGNPISDSARFRLRLSGFVHAYCPQTMRFGLGQTVQTEMGVRVFSGDFHKFFETAELRDVLDCITVIFKSLPSAQLKIQWQALVQRALSEENLGYALDPNCGVHLSVDEEFNRNRAATLALLNLPRHSAALAFFERTFADLDSTPPDTRNALRHLFDAVENLFKIMTEGSSARLDPTSASKKLRPIIEVRYVGVAQAAANQTLESFLKWVVAVYQYRHADDAERFEPPPIDLTIILISTGAAYLRWLLQIDNDLQGRED